MCYTKRTAFSMHASRRHNFFLIASLLVFLIGIFFVPVFVFSESAGQSGGVKDDIESLNQAIAEKKEKVRQLEESIAAYKKKINQKKLEATSLSNQLQIIEQNASEVGLDIKATEEKINTIELEIQAVQLSIQEAEQTILRQQEIIAAFLRTLYQEGGRDMIDILAIYENFSDFYGQIQYMKTIEQDLSRNTQALRLAKVVLDEQKLQAEERKLSQELLQDDLEKKHADLQSQSYVKEELLLATKSSESEYSTLLQNLKSQYQKIEGEISSIEQQVRRKLEASDKLNQPNVQFDGKLSWPSDSRYVTAYFHDTFYPYRYIFEHNAIDIKAAHGTPIRATAAGYVGRAKTCTTASCYAYVMIVHSGGLSTVYGHLSKITVAADQFVTRGDIIGYSGATPGTVGAGPFTTGPHLHFEVRKDGIPVNPLLYLVKDY